MNLSTQQRWQTKMRPPIKLAIASITLALAGTAFAASAATSAPAEKLPLTDLDRFTTVIEHIKNYYVKNVEDSTLFENAIRGMLAGLDPHSAYLNQDEFAELKASTSGKFGGLGIEVTLEDGYIKVISPIDGTPAAKAGMQPGDLIVRLDETPVKDLSLTEAVDRMRGKPGTEIFLTVVRKNESKPLKLKLTREVINVHSVHSKMLEEGYAYIRISQFQNDTGTELGKEIKKLTQDGKTKLKGLVLDLRNNPGGVLDASVTAASAFLDKDKLPYDKVVVFTKGRINGSQVKEKANGKDLLKGAPIIVLVNSGSASASEIVAGCLQDYKRAIILGTPTFGKASVQTVLPLKDQRGLKLTTALYYTPAGRSIQAKGIIPDIVVDNVSIPKPKAGTSE
ncbi:MAG TPA: S41 family peptidase, partial [Gammaproteobacteria bacterium]|nr:S41 family peptidase [Gammaproteobacteria bacterium]